MNPPLGLNKNRFDVVIVGAGVIGCSIAYFLAKTSKNKIKIAVIERNVPGSESTAGAAGMLAAQIESESSGAFFDLLLQSRNLFEALAAELKQDSGVDIEYIKSGIAAIAFTEEEEQKLRERYAWQRKSNLECDWLSSGEVQQKYPFLRRTDFGGFFAPQDAQVSASRLATAFELAAKKMGVAFFDRQTVSALDLQEPKLNSLKTNHSVFFADRFIFAAGAWTGKILNGLVPVEPVKGQILIFEMNGEYAEPSFSRSPLFLGNTPGENPIHCYLVPKKDHHLYLGATMEHRGFDQSENKDATTRMVEYALRIFPDLSAFGFKGAWIGLRPGSSDGLPLLGLAPGLENVYVASGHFRNGILLAPITGKIISDILFERKTPFNPEPFSPARFLCCPQTKTPPPH